MNSDQNSKYVWEDVLKTIKQLDPKTLKVVKSTLPAVKEHGVAIMTRFYQNLFKNHPELINMFNQTHQKTGHQPKALANAVYGAAANIEDMSGIMPVLERIGQKHRSVQVKPEHYPIIGEHLLGAIKEILGEAATDEIMSAWADAYEVISDVFIRMEDKLYKTAENQPGGWAGFKKFIVDRKVRESEVITSFYLKSIDEKELPRFIPGQYITIKLDSQKEEFTHLRQYSLSDRPGKNYFRISVKREDPLEEGYLPGVVSNELHKLFNEGDILPISAPAGDFYLDLNSTDPVVLISGGVGITPMMSMINTIVNEQPERMVYFIHAAMNSKVHAFKHYVNDLVSTHQNAKSFVIYQKPTDKDKDSKNFDKEGYITLDWLQTVLPTNKAQFYFCGPKPFMKAVNDALLNWGVPSNDIHYEFFGAFDDLDS